MPVRLNKIKTSVYRVKLTRRMEVSMKTSLVALTLISLAVSAAPQDRGARLARCLHGRTETADQKLRREKAIRVAQAINTAQVIAVGPRKPQYRRPEELPSIPPLPQGFALQFNTDGATYTFSIKDTLDACHYAIFSDEDKLIYDGTPLSKTILMPVTTQ
jgi:hypothetical protein